MAVQIEQHSPSFAATVHGIDLAHSMTDDERARMRQLARRYAVLVIKDQHDLDKDALLSFSSIFGRPSGCGDITNLDAEGNIRSVSDILTKQTKANEVWHVDMLAVSTPPVACFLLAKELPKRVDGQGETQFVDLTQIWERLPVQRRRRLLGKQALHSFQALSKRTGPDYPLDLVAQYEPTVHPLVTVDPLSDKKIVLIGGHTEKILDSDEDVDMLINLASTPDNIYTHQWSAGDLIVWNNRRVVHRVTPYDLVNERRRLMRVEALGDKPKAYEASLVERIFSFAS